MEMALLILGMGVCTFLPRYLPLALFGERELPGLVKTALAYLPAALLAAIAVPSVLAPDGAHIDLTHHLPVLIAGTVTLVLGLVTERFLVVWGVGTALFFALQLLV